MFRLPVVEISAAFWKATLPALVTEKLLETVVAPCSAIPPLPAAIATPPVLLVLPIVVTPLPETLMLVAPKMAVVELALPRETVPLYEPVPKLVAVEPLVLILVAPSTLVVELALPIAKVPL